MINLTTKEMLAALLRAGYREEMNYLPKDDDSEFEMYSPDGSRHFTGEIRSGVIRYAYEYMLEREKLANYEFLRKQVQDYSVALHKVFGLAVNNTTQALTTPQSVKISVLLDIRDICRGVLIPKGGDNGREGVDAL